MDIINYNNDNNSSNPEASSHSFFLSPWSGYYFYFWNINEDTET